MDSKFSKGIDRMWFRLGAGIVAVMFVLVMSSCGRVTMENPQANVNADNRCLNVAENATCSAGDEGSHDNDSQETNIEAGNDVDSNQDLLPDQDNSTTDSHDAIDNSIGNSGDPDMEFDESVL